jgi:uncharacterized protein YegL
MPDLKTTLPTVVYMILDESTSMSCAKTSTINGYNEHIDMLKKSNNPDIYASLIKFSEVISNAIPLTEINNVPTLTDQSYSPNGCTALYDAIGTVLTDHETNSKIVEIKSKYSDMKNIMIILTDGDDNSSRKFSATQIKELIADFEKTGNWTFVYLGAEQDSWKATDTLGINAANVTNISYATMDGAMEYTARRVGAFANSSLRSSSNFMSNVGAQSVRGVNVEDLLLQTDDFEAEAKLKAEEEKNKK